MPDVRIRQLEDPDVRLPLLPIGEASRVLRERLESTGVAFSPDDDPSLPGPSDTAAIEIHTGTQFAFEHHHTHPNDFVLIRAEAGSVRPADRIDELVRSIGIDPSVITRIEADWHGA